MGGGSLMWSASSMSLNQQYKLAPCQLDDKKHKRFKFGKFELKESFQSETKFGPIHVESLTNLTDWHPVNASLLLHNSHRPCYCNIGYQ